MGMLSNLTSSIGKSLGMGGPSDQEIQDQQWEAYNRERERLEREKQESIKEAKFVGRETNRKDVALTFGDSARSRNLSSERKSVRSTGRFDEARLVL